MTKRNCLTPQAPNARFAKWVKLSKDITTVKSVRIQKGFVQCVALKLLTQVSTNKRIFEHLTEYLKNI
jgi:hypothetical protein